MKSKKRRLSDVIRCLLQLYTIVFIGIPVLISITGDSIQRDYIDIAKIICIPAYFLMLAFILEGNGLLLSRRRNLPWR